MLRGIVGAAVGGLIGAAIWAAVAYFTDLEIGWIAWGIGGLAGLGMRFGLDAPGDARAGVAAALVAVAGIALGKYLAVSFSVGALIESDDFVIAAFADVVMVEQQVQGAQFPPSNPNAESIADMYPATVWLEAQGRWNQLSDADKERMRELPMRSYPDYLVSVATEELAGQRVQAGETIVWPTELQLGIAWHETHFPPDLWAAGRAYLDGLTEAERATYVAAIEDFYLAQYQVGLDALRSDATGGGFADSFTPYDLLWAGLALFTAFSVAQSSRSAGPSATDPSAAI